ncbi:retropepsin-like aspartic protease [Formosa sp. PL04]|uniref:retropepsin-like aspartic protease n=1 Tax=Formosa sp. PL04 TaxID=3081755 RepID=UPI002980C379|nr:retropepsin-like aspartic protease [Formosa sp. PL04]MDW5289930.1 retropepsin-like aspartic protease [Formosa sp. PL04]
MKNNLLLILIFSVSIVSCSSLKRLKTVTQGDVKQEHYFEEIPFKYIKNQIVLEVSIDGNAYNFIFDTGNDLTVIDYSVLEAIHYESNNVNGEISDSNGISRESKYVSIDDLKIGNINFLDTGAYTSDLSHFYQFLGKDSYSGIIGSNLMRKAKWQIDYKNKVIRLSDNMDHFKISTEALIFKTNSGKYGDAEIKIKLNTTENKYTFDTGYSGFVSAQLSTFNTLNANNTIPYITTTGINSIGANGIMTNIKYSTLLSIQLLDILNATEQLVTFAEGDSNVLGNSFFEKFTVTLDWNNEKFYLDQNDQFEPSILEEYQVFFHPDYLKNQIIIYGYENNYVLDKPIAIGTQILAIDGVDVSHLDTQALHTYWTNRNFAKTIEIEVNENGTSRTVLLTEKQLLPK